MCGSVGSCAGAEKGALGSLGEAAVRVPRQQGAGWRGLGFSASSLLVGVEYAAVCLLKRVHMAVWESCGWGCRGRALGGMVWY
jgi:hypothetical protein